VCARVCVCVCERRVEERGGVGVGSGG
jgi:hypothetical protein